MMHIISDSQAAVKALNELARTRRINFMWVPGHNDNDGNFKADELAARKGTTADIYLAQIEGGILLSTQN